MKTTHLCGTLASALLIALIPSSCAELAGLKDYQVGPQGDGGAGGQGGSGGAGTGGTGIGGAGGTGGAGGGMLCVPDSSTSCYTGLMGTEGVGACKPGTTTCNAQGTAYGPCNNQVTPVDETCVTPDDDDCDGSVNEEGVDCGCTPNMSEPCYSGPPGTESNLPCMAGLRTCNALGTGYGPCVGEVLPQTEACSPALDENCDGNPSCNGGYVWAKTFLGGTSFTLDVAFDGAGNTYATGIFTDTVDFNGRSLTSAGAEDIFLVKLDPAGAVLWVKQFGDGSAQSGQSLAVDAAGNVVLTGYFDGAVDFGGGALTSAGGEDIFLAKLNAAGNHVFSKAFGDAAQQNGFGVAIDAAGNIVLVGKMAGAADFGGGDLVSASGVDVFIAKLNAAGDHQWSKRYGEAGDQVASGVAVDDAGDVFVIGSFANTVDFGGGPLTSMGGDDIFLAKLAAADGASVWANRFGDNAHQSGLGVATDTAGNVLVTGHFYGSVNFGLGSLFAGAAQQDVYAAKFSGGGQHQWSKDYGDSADQLGPGIAVDGQDNVLLTGYFSGAVDFGGGPLTSAGLRDIYLAKLAPGGGHIWAKRFGGAGADFAESVAVDAAGNIALGGYFLGQIDFGGGAITAANDSAFVTKLLP